MGGLIIATCQDKEKEIDVNFYLNVRFRICMSLIPLQAMCHVYTQAEPQSFGCSITVDSARD
jgi:hypothetical protein